MRNEMTEEEMDSAFEEFYNDKSRTFEFVASKEELRKAFISGCERAVISECERCAAIARECNAPLVAGCIKGVS